MAITKPKEFKLTGFKQTSSGLISVSWLREDADGSSVQIVGNYTHPESEQVTGIKTSKMQLHNSFYGFEGELKKVLVNLSSEACAYVFDNKSSQQSLPLEKVA